MPTRIVSLIIYKRRKEKERREVLLIATAVLAIGGAGIAACFTAIMHVDAAALEVRQEIPTTLRYAPPVHRRAQFCTRF